MSARTIDAAASEPHYLDHLAPVWNAIPRQHRGQFLVPDALVGRARARGVAADEITAWRSATAEFGIAASYRDLVWLGDRPAILMEHGAGQSYGGDPTSARHVGYAGGDGRENVVLFLNPGEHPRRRNAERYPEATSLAIGSPRLDQLLELAAETAPAHEPTIAVTFHWGAEVAPESRPAWTYWRWTLLDALAETGWRILGHGHPRALPELAGWYENAGVLVVPELDQLVVEADAIVGDNTSTMFEFAALDRPVLCLDAPWYRRDVDHGLRFWNSLPGPIAADPNGLATLLPDWLDLDVVRKFSRPAAAAAYSQRDGYATARAAEAILEVLE